MLFFNRPFYYYYLSNTIYKETQHIKHAAVAPHVKTGKFWFFVNPVTFLTYDLNEGVWTLAHETIHIVAQHPLSKFMRHPRWNWACDLEANEILIAQGFKPPLDEKGRPKDILIEYVIEVLETQWILLGTPKKIPHPGNCKAAEYYLQWIVENQPPASKDKPDDSSDDQSGQPELGGSGSGDGEPTESEEGSESSEPSDDSESEETEDSSESEPDDGSEPEESRWEDALDEKSDHQFEWFTENMTQESQQAVRTMVAASVQQAAQNAKPPANIAGLVEELIQSLTPKLSWRQQTRRFTGRLGRLEPRVTMSRENKYGQMPSITFKPRKRVLFAIDTSASMNKHAIAQIIAELEAVSRFCDVDIMYVDMAVRSVQPFKKRTEYNVLGRTYTDMRKIFEWIKENKKLYDGVIIGSDAETAFPTRADRMGIPTLWIVTNNYYEVPPEAGDSIRWEEDING